MALQNLKIVSQFQILSEAKYCDAKNGIREKLDIFKVLQVLKQKKVKLFDGQAFIFKKILHANHIGIYIIRQGNHLGISTELYLFAQNC